MPKKPSEPSLIEIIIAGRWPVAATVSAVCFVAFLIVPGMLASNIFLVALAPLARAILLLAFIALAIVALVKFLHETSAARTADQVTKYLAVVARARQRESERERPRHARDRVDPVAPAQSEPDVRLAPDAWSLELLQAIEWKRFEEVVAAYFRAKNFRCETIEYGPDGGVDGRLYFGDRPTPVGVVQCKAWAQQVGVKPVRELLGVMAHEKVARGYFCATGDFSADAVAFARTNPIKLISGRDLLDAIAQMPAAAQRQLLAVSTTGDYTTPTCPSCGIKLVERTIGGKAAWGCRNFPRCRVKIFRRLPSSMKAAA